MSVARMSFLQVACHDQPRPTDCGTDGLRVALPPADTPLTLEVAPDTTLVVPWGAYWQFGTPAYWANQYFLRRSGLARSPFALGSTLLEESAACVLGGYGIPAWVGLAAFRRVRASGLLDGHVRRPDEFLRVLSMPLRCEVSSRSARYRFARQRSARLAGVCRFFAVNPSPPVCAGAALRDWLCGIPGIGPKTASWIVRNHTGSDDVAIIDVHLRRAGVRAGFFLPQWQLPRDYGLFERAFLLFSRAIGVGAAALDAVIWNDQRLLTCRARSAD